MRTVAQATGLVATAAVLALAGSGCGTDDTVVEPTAAAEPVVVSTVHTPTHDAADSLIGSQNYVAAQIDAQRHGGPAVP
jgi:hypothetical protein